MPLQTTGISHDAKPSRPFSCVNLKFSDPSYSHTTYDPAFNLLLALILTLGISISDVLWLLSSIAENASPATQNHTCCPPSRPLNFVNSEFLYPYITPTQLMLPCLLNWFLNSCTFTLPSRMPYPKESLYCKSLPSYTFSLFWTYVMIYPSPPPPPLVRRNERGKRRGYTKLS